MNDTPSQILAEECRTHSDNCLYTATTLFEYLKWIKFYDKAIQIAAIVCGALATWQIFQEESKFAAMTFALLAGLLPPVYDALKLVPHIEAVEKAAAENKALQHRFRHAALASVHKPFIEFEQEVKELMERLEAVIALRIATPNWAFKRAQKKIKPQKSESVGEYVFAPEEQTFKLAHERNKIPLSK